MVKGAFDLQLYSKIVVLGSLQSHDQATMLVDKTVHFLFVEFARKKKFIVASEGERFCSCQTTRFQKYPMHVDIAGPDILRLYVSPVGFTVEEKFLALLLGPNLSNLRDSRF